MWILMLLGCVFFFVGWIWLIIKGFKVGIKWGIINIILQPLTGLIFCIFKKAGWLPFLIMVAGLFLFGWSGGVEGVTNYLGISY